MCRRLLGELVGQPVQPLVQTRPLSRARGLNVPLQREDRVSHTHTHGWAAGTCVCVCAYGSTPQAVQTQFVGQFAHAHGVWKVLFVSKHQDHGVFELVLLDLGTRRTPGVR